MFEQTLGGSLRNLAIGLVLTAAVVGAGFALAFYWHFAERRCAHSAKRFPRPRLRPAQAQCVRKRLFHHLRQAAVNRRRV